MKAGYAFQGQKSAETQNIAKAVGRNLNISPKQSIEICAYLRGRTLSQAKNLLQMSINMEKAIPFKRFTNGLGHKPGIGAGRFNIKACSEILKVVKSAEANAKNKGLNVTSLKVIHIAAQRSNKNWHYGRKKRSIFKNSHIEVVLEESKDSGNRSGKAAGKNNPAPKKTAKKPSIETKEHKEN